MDVGPFDDPVRPGETVDWLRFDVHELENLLRLFQSRRERLHLRFELGDASHQTLRGGGRGGSGEPGEHDGDEETDPNEERAWEFHA